MAWWQYLALTNLYLALFYGFYILLLRKETFFQLNRVYLVASVVLSFIIPAIQADWLQDLFITQQVKYVIYNQPVLIYKFAPQVDNDISIGQVLCGVYIAGVLILAIRLIWQLQTLTKLIARHRPGAAYSFIKKVRVSDELANNDIIAAHEEVHALQWHSADVLLMEAVMILNWFNPVVYFYRRAIKHIHEFIADSRVIALGADKAAYALLLLNHTLNAPSHQLVNQFFNHSLLKKRIMMLQKNRSQRVKLAKYGLSAPLFALMLILSSATINNSTAVNVLKQRSAAALATPVNTVVLPPAVEAVPSAQKIPLPVIAQKEAMHFQADTVPGKPDEVFSAVERQPQFPDGITKFYEFLGRTIRYPAADREKKVTGRVIATFIVEKDGSLSDVKALRGPSQAMQDEAVRAISLSPKWVPGYQNGKPVRVQFTVPIAFDLSAEKAPSVQPTPNKYLSKLVVTDRNANSTAPAQANVYNTFSTDTSGTPKAKVNNLMLTKPLIMLDGKEITQDMMKNIDPKSIESVSVLKEQSAVAPYGEKGKNGVILIVTKKK